MSPGAKDFDLYILLVDDKPYLQRIPRWFQDKHGDKFRENVYLVAGPSARTWTVRVYIVRANYMNNFSKNKVPPLTLSSGWNEFATFHGLVENDRLIFALKAMSTFEVYIFHPTGEPKEPPTSREQVTEVQELLQKKGCKKSWESARNLQGNGMTVAQLVKLQNAQRLKASRDRKKERKLNARRKKDATPSLELLQRAVDIFEPVDQLFIFLSSSTDT